MRALGFEMQPDEIRQIAEEVDPKGRGFVSRQDFTDLMAVKMATRDPVQEMVKAFRLFDEDENGFISFKDLKKVCKDVGENIADDELQEMIEEADRDGDGVVNLDEFIRIMKKSGAFETAPYLL
eukprot:GHVP01010881.1.p2 GENE.GHVP01010881.1~~GHVP01010881.1.p2  ORF type:complete len:124 (-),score=23.18 GHVP01010881.1:79-450(-)